MLAITQKRRDNALLAILDREPPSHVQKSGLDLQLHLVPPVSDAPASSDAVDAEPQAMDPNGDLRIVAAAPDVKVPPWMPRTKPVRKKPVQLEDKKPTTIGKSAFRIFKDDEGHKHPGVDPTDAEFHQQCKNTYKLLTPEKVENYERRARASKAKAFFTRMIRDGAERARKRSSPALLALQDQQLDEGTSVAVRTSPALLALQDKQLDEGIAVPIRREGPFRDVIFPAPPRRLEADSRPATTLPSSKVSMVNALQKPAMTGIQFEEALARARRLDRNQPPPALTSESFNNRGKLKRLSNKRRKQSTLNDMICSFQTVHEQMGGKGAGPLPKKTNYHLPSGPVSAMDYPEEERPRINCLKASLRAAAKAVASWHGKPAEVGRRKMLLALRAISAGDRQVDLRFVYLASASARSGPVPERQNFLALDAITPYNRLDTDFDHLQGTVVELLRNDFITPLNRRTGQPKSMRSPFHEMLTHKLGEVFNLNEDSLLAWLLYDHPRLDMICIQKLSHKRVPGRMDRWHITGVDEAFEELIVSSYRAEQAEEQDRDAALGDEEAPAGGGSHNDDDDDDEDCDWLGLGAATGMEGQRMPANETPKGSEHDRSAHEFSAIIGEALRLAMPELEELEISDGEPKEPAARPSSTGDKPKKGTKGKQCTDGGEADDCRLPGHGDVLDIDYDGDDQDDLPGEPISVDGVRRAKSHVVDGFVALKDAIDCVICENICQNRDDLKNYFHVEFDNRWCIRPLLPLRPDFAHIPRDKSLGDMRPIQGHALQMVCTRHSGCNLILPCTGRFRLTECLLAQWALGGWAPHCSASDHVRARDLMRERYGRKG